MRLLQPQAAWINVRFWNPLLLPGPLLWRSLAWEQGGDLPQKVTCTRALIPRDFGGGGSLLYFRKPVPAHSSPSSQRAQQKHRCPSTEPEPQWSPHKDPAHVQRNSSWICTFFFYCFPITRVMDAFCKNYAFQNYKTWEYPVILISPSPERDNPC